MKKTFLIAEMDVPDIFNDKCIRDLAATAKLKLTAANFDAFKKGVRNAVVNYLRELRVPSHNELHREVKALERAASRREFEKVADLLEDLSAETRASLNERCGRVGWRNLFRDIGGARVPSPDMLRDPELRELNCTMVGSLCRMGGGSTGPILYGPEPRRNFKKRDAERWFITCLRDAFYRATVDPPITAYERAQKLGKRGATLPVDHRGRHRLHVGDGFLLVDPDGTERLHIWDAMGRWVDASKAVPKIFPIKGRMPGWTAHGDPALTGPFARMVKKCLCLVGGGRKVSAVNQINTLNKYRKAKAAPSERQTLAAFLTAVYGEYGNARWRAADLFTERRQAALSEALSEITNTKGKMNPWVLGKWLARHTNRWCDGLRLEKSGGRAGVIYWRARKMPEGGG